MYIMHNCILQVVPFYIALCLFASVHLPLSLCIHPSFCASCLLSQRPSRVPVSHQSCAASCLILPSPIIVRLNYRACQPSSGELFVMWTGLDRTERGCAVQRGTLQCCEELFDSTFSTFALFATLDTYFRSSNKIECKTMTD